MIKERVNHLDGLLKILFLLLSITRLVLQPDKIDFESEINPLSKSFVFNTNVEVYLEVHHEENFFTEPIRLRTILQNLISNALKYHNPHASPPLSGVESP